MCNLDHDVTDTGSKPVLDAFDKMVLSVDREAAAAQSRFTHLALLNLNLRLMENWRSLQKATLGKALDSECTLILMAIVVISAERLLRVGMEPHLESLGTALPKSHVSKANLSSIAAATGINRETVRRKVNDLQEAGLVVRDGRDVRTAASGVQLDVLEECILAQLDVITRTVNQLAKRAVLKLKRQ